MLIDSLLFFLLEFITGGVSFISRHPPCGRYTANFTVKDTGKYFEGEIIHVIPNGTFKACALKCVFTAECLFFNLKLDDSRCELLGSHVGTLIKKAGWVFRSTGYTNENFMRRGPMCRYVQAKCDWSKQFCDDSCEAPGFHCVNHGTNVALGKDVKASTEYVSPKSFFKAEFVNDGDIDTFWGTLKRALPWISIDLERKYLIGLVSLVQRQDKIKNWAMQKAMTIRIGDNDAEDLEKNLICKESVNMEGISEAYVFCIKPLLGRFVSVKREDDGNDNYFQISEIKVFAF